MQVELPDTLVYHISSNKHGHLCKPVLLTAALFKGMAYLFSLLGASFRGSLYPMQQNNDTQGELVILDVMVFMLISTPEKLHPLCASVDTPEIFELPTVCMCRLGSLGCVQLTAIDPSSIRGLK